jgi:DNA mismatch endonuclease, patch repair protein
MKVRKALGQLGAHYRLNASGLPGRPDIANRSRRKAIFVHGCFWHCHIECGRGVIPKANETFWKDKLAKNMERDKLKIDGLLALGFDVLLVWECELKDSEKLLEKLSNFWYKPVTGTLSGE